MEYMTAYLIRSLGIHQMLQDFNGHDILLTLIITLMYEDVFS